MTTSTHTEEYQVLRAILRDARLNAGVTQQQLAEKLGKPQSYVAKVEGGERRIDVNEFIAFARAIDIDPTTLFRSVLAKLKSQ
ncbi:helix-turn-helix domain-containing protein [Agrobacterium sp. ES01]|uniref:helix-turn-helix domain-containing protein n=1 Tax=Agrobacterium sp. ES01 TaxID=3420714 RepID=UPI003D0B852F